ncbi:shufflon system plasmid conjugative transfer pilus tip adhesin PilV [Scandinavium lactucae]|uniref:Shufflon system plasmid conjugative transfer pilus tip adhesin PilV n=1 Tax=Scandinavium lactucae TaxID=3095028 RepID=A0ABU4QVG9_9ENTR|nr:MULTISPECIES: shufflon system plasmid conjugative transfer pilus tip adhesin PilV [unclassified Scandinavium]MDX6041265.1 shufflon system plasmid conjugative transfer pilus tip adhesin PilV [Scandinavium sp. V105_6]MDX6049783.1 shufflon system plasmid conjugative transfer pilus tip adhesin PilV [Scandinavium sp. V105_1]
MTKKKARPRINRGISLISVAIVLTIVLLAAPIGMERYANFINEQSWAVTATHLGTVNQGARLYIQDNYDTLLNQVKGGGKVTVTGQTLRDKGYLPAGFALSNNSTQTYILAVTRNPTQTDKLVAFVLTAGGQELPFKAQRYIAQNTSGLGGYIYPANVASGASGGWQVNLASMGLSGQTGHLVTYLTSDALAGGAEESDRLYRFAVNGRPDLNRMHTNIDMNGNNINSAKAVNAQTGTFSGTVTAGAVTSKGDVRSQSGWLITKGSKGWLNEDHGGGLYMDDNNWIKSLNGKGIFTTGQVQAGSVQSNGRMTTNEFVQINGVASTGASCSPNGLVGRDSSGGILSCQSGVWKSSGSTVNISEGIIDYGSHLEEFGTAYKIPDDSCVVVNYPRPMRTVFAINVSIVNNKNTSGGEISSAYATKLNASQFQICVKNKGFTAKQDVEWRAIGVS